MLQKYLCSLTCIFVNHGHFHRLNRRTHLVHTGVSLVRKMVNEVEQYCFHEQTSVTFGQLSDEIITAYVESGEPL